MNSQREVVYKRRRNALYGDRLAVDVANMFMETSESMILDFQDARDFEGFRLEVIRIFSMNTAISQESFLKEKPEILAEKLYHEVGSFYKRKSEHIAQVAFPVINQVFENQGQQYENILIPISDGMKNMQLLVNLKKAVDSHGKEVVNTMERMITLAMIDDAWKEHLREMDELKQSVQHAVYEQKDPLLIYKLESFDLFRAMMGKVGKEISAFLLKGNLPTQQASDNQSKPSPQVTAASTPTPRPVSNLRMSRSDLPPSAINTQEQSRPTTVVNTDPKIGRNDTCPCGRGKKYKNCHGALVAE
jgi:preprotein translocase subunit SecA